VKKNSISQPVVSDVANFLAELYKSGASYNTINVARCAVAAYLNTDGSDSVGKHPIICRLVKGVFENRPALPRYSDIWDVDIVLQKLSEWAEADTLRFDKLTYRTIMLLALLSAQRCQTIHTLNVQDVQFVHDGCVIKYSSVLKQTKPGKSDSFCKPLHLKSFVDKKLCIVHHLDVYIKRSKSLRSCSKLFIGLVKPHKAVSKDTIARWIKVVLKLADIDVSKFSAHSTRAASTSAAALRDVPLSSIMTAAGWTRQSTFTQFYEKHVGTDGDEVSAQRQKTLSQAVLERFMNKH
jgi:integrase